MAPARKHKNTELKNEENALRQPIVTRAFLDEQMIYAKREYPDPEGNKALEKYAHKNGIEGIFFRDDEGRRCLWDKEIYYFQHKGPRSYGAVEEWVGTRRYFVQQREKNMYQINMPKSAKKSKLIAHRSESGWNLPHTDDHHFFKFPLEIQEIIIDMVVTVPSSKSITPILTSSNWVRTWQLPEYRVSDYKGEESGLALQNSNGRDGQYIHMYPVRRAAIDASYKKMHFRMFGNGNALARNLVRVYKGKGKNRKSGLHEWVPDPSKPSSKDDDYEKKMLDAMNAISRGWETMKLPGFVYHDEFLRMLNGIRLRNPGFLRQLSFAGQVKLHQCWYKGCGNQCYPDLVHSLRIYAPFMAQFCTGLEKLHIGAWDDRLSDDDLQHALLNRLPTNTEEALQPLFAHLRSIESLEELVVVDGDGSPLECAKPTQLWLKERTAVRDRVARDAEGQTLSSKIQSLDIGTSLKLNPAAPIFDLSAFH